jgi:tRNA (cytosine38-C5)-methyltransferase
MPPSPEPRCVEFYCGIGGLHYSLQRAHAHARVVACYDVNPVSNDVYAHNFGLRPSGRDIRALTCAELDAHEADVWLLSPPCQPYTRNGLQLDKEDGRAGSFGCLLAVLQRMQHPPQRLLIENVVGFDTSAMRGDLLDQLTAMGYMTHEYVLSPNQFGVPYSRPRYFMTAALRPAPGCALATPLPATPWPHPPPGCAAVAASAALREYLEAGASWAEHQVPWSALRRSLLAVDFVHADTRFPAACANCVTKSYGRYAKGTGSLLLHSADDVQRLFDAVQRAARRNAAAADSGCQESSALGEFLAAHVHDWPCDAPPLRYLTPREVARLHGFPESFAFPDSVTRLQRYALLGNSLSVDVVAPLLSHLLADL